MPFLRAALLKKKLQAETERPVVILTPVVEEQTESQEPEEFTPTQIEDLHRLIDAKTEEAPESVLVVEVETVTEIIAQEAHEESQPEEAEIETETQEPQQEPETVPSPEAEYAPEETEPESQQEEEPKNDAEEFTVTDEIVHAPEDAGGNADVLEVQETESSDTQAGSDETGGDAPGETQQEEDLGQEAAIPAESVAWETAEAETEALLEPDTVTEEPQPEAEIVTEDNAQPEAESLTEEITETEPEDSPAPNLPPEIAEALAEQEPDPVPEESPEPESAPASHKDYSGSQLDYDFTSGERYVDKVSTKTDFDKMLDELAAISKDLLSWEAEKFAKSYAGKFSEGDSSVAEARKFEAFLGGYITNAAMLLYDKGYKDAAIKQLKQAVSILQARKKLEDETTAIKSRVEEQNDDVDLSDILGMFGDG